jgi:leucyl-tRNA---protein transferase
MIRETFQSLNVNPRGMDLLWLMGFRHFGTLFFRYDSTEQGSGNVHVLPLRIDLHQFTLSKSQKRIMKRNQDLQVVFRDAFIDEEKYRIFDIHKRRFTENIPGDLCDFISSLPAEIPCRTQECCLYHEGTLIGVGFLDRGEKAVSAVYTIYDTAYMKRSLGIYILLQEILYAREAGMHYLYHGYAYREASFYDYKKKFAGLKYYDWQGHWLAMDTTSETAADR